jgi:F5/8 type C domain
MLDLQAVYEVDRIRWTGGAWTPYPAQSPGDYTVAVSEDGRRWSAVATRTNPAGVINGSEPVRLNARYIKLTTTKVNEGSGWALAFHEFWVEGRPLPATCP